MFKNALLWLALFVFVGPAAWAADPFTVSGVSVDATGESAIAAQTQAITEGQVKAANAVIKRVTLAQERKSVGFEGLTPQVAVKLIRAMEIANEKRSANRYLGDITVAFNPSSVQNYLRGKNLTMITTQSRDRLVVPVITGKIASDAHPWGAAWSSQAFAHALTPLRAAASGQRLPITGAQALSGDLPALRRAAATVNSNQVLIAEVSETSSGVSVALTDIALDSGQRRALGSVNGIDYAGAALKAVEFLEDDWKQAAISQRENAKDMSVSVLFANQSDWQRLQSAINDSAQISDARLDALSKDGALMTIRYGGDLNRLANELSFKGVKFEQLEALGAVLSLSGR